MTFEQLGLLGVMQTTPKTGGGAIFSQPDRRFRYCLWRTWDAAVPPAVFVMLNPSKAGEKKDDPTLKKCVGFARRWGAGGVVLVNLFARVETESAELARMVTSGEDVVGVENDAHLRANLRIAKHIVFATGNVAFARDRFVEVLRMVAEDQTVWCLGVTVEGYPKHPSRLGYATTQKVFDGLPSARFVARGLTFWRPWAEAILYDVPEGATAPGRKDVDNRSFPPGFMTGQLLVIHTGKHIHQEGIDWLRKEYGYPWTAASLASPGLLLGAARVAGHITEGTRPWYFGPSWQGKPNIGWILEDVRRFKTPIEFSPRFARGLWTMPEEVLALVRHRYEEGIR